MKIPKPNSKARLCIGARSMLVSRHRKAVQRHSPYTAYVVWDSRTPAQPDGALTMRRDGTYYHRVYQCLPDNSRCRKIANDYGWLLLARITNDGQVLLKGARAEVVAPIPAKPKPRLSLLKTPATCPAPVTQLPPPPGYDSPVVHI